MANRDERMVEFRLKGPMNNRLPNVGKIQPGERCLMRVSAMLCLFPEHHQIRTIENGWTVEVFEEDWGKVEKAFRSAYLGGEVHAIGGVLRHGVNCPKADHDPLRDGYLHGEDDDSPYDVDHVKYCGRCHRAL